jgi:hypothetical protein
MSVPLLLGVSRRNNVDFSYVASVFVESMFNLSCLAYHNMRISSVRSECRYSEGAGAANTQLSCYGARFGAWKPRWARTH